MHTICFVEGACKECGCATTALQMSSKACEGNCYPAFVDKDTWKHLKKGEIIVRNEIHWCVKSTGNNEYEFCKYREVGEKNY